MASTGELDSPTDNMKRMVVVFMCEPAYALRLLDPIHVEGDLPS